MKTADHQTRAKDGAFIRLSRVVTCLVSCIAGLILLLMLAALALGGGHKPSPTEKTVPIIEAFACLSGFVFVVSSALLCGLIRFKPGQPILLASLRGAVCVAAVIVVLGGGLLWGFLYFAG